MLNVLVLLWLLVRGLHRRSPGRSTSWMMSYSSSSEHGVGSNVGSDIHGIVKEEDEDDDDEDDEDEDKPGNEKNEEEDRIDDVALGLECFSLSVKAPIMLLSFSLGGEGAIGIKGEEDVDVEDDDDDDTLRDAADLRILECRPRKCSKNDERQRSRCSMIAS
jgi:hypothetical protein